MTKVAPIIELHPWLALPAGQAMLQWEQDQIDLHVADVFGFHALQLGLPELDGLRANRMPHRWLALDTAYQDWRPPVAPLASQATEGGPLSLRCDFESLPFPAHSLDLVVLGHSLELARDAHHTLREVERVLVPEGRVVIAGFNPASLWGLSQRMGRWGVTGSPLLPPGELIAYWRLRDWLRLLDMEVEAACFAGHRPLVRSQRWWDRLQGLDRLGERWWPVLGAVYVVVAVKRARGLRLVGKVAKARLAPAAAPVVATQRSRRQSRIQEEVEG